MLLGGPSTVAVLPLAAIVRLDDAVGSVPVLLLTSDMSADPALESCLCC